MATEKGLEYGKVKPIIRELLETDPRCRDDDTWLIIKTLQKLGFKIYIPYEDIPKMPSFETIRRCRCKFQEEGLYPPSENCKRKRVNAEHTTKAIIQNWESNDKGTVG